MLLGNYTLMPLFGDSDFSNDCWQAHENLYQCQCGTTRSTIGRMAAWMRYMPLDWGDVMTPSSDFSRIKLHRNFRFGNLLNLVFTEQRLQRTIMRFAKMKGMAHWGRAA
ncbi:MAG: hypothetical protein U1F55_08045 [Chitinivorax sp.]